MADSVVDKVETEVVEKEKEKQTKVEDTSEDSKQSENGDSTLKENGEKAEENDESKDTENGDSTDAVETCKVKRKSGGGGDAPEGTQAEGASPEKKAKLDEKVVDGESNGGEAKAAA